MPRPRRHAAPPDAAPTTPRTIDLNADVGESYGAWTMGDDAALLPLVTSANVACGAHAGDPLVMARTVALARRLGVSVGAHPGYPDRDGFGRRDLPMTGEELRASLLAQLGALDGDRAGGRRHAASREAAWRPLQPRGSGPGARGHHRVGGPRGIAGSCARGPGRVGAADGRHGRRPGGDPRRRSRTGCTRRTARSARAASRTRCITTQPSPRSRRARSCSTAACALTTAAGSPSRPAPCASTATRPGAPAIAAAVRAALSEAGVTLSAPGGPA